jgi:hypothetical protein
VGCTWRNRNEKNTIVRYIRNIKRICAFGLLLFAKRTEIGAGDSVHNGWRSFCGWQEKLTLFCSFPITHTRKVTPPPSFLYYFPTPQTLPSGLRAFWLSELASLFCVPFLVFRRNIEHICHANISG